MILRLLADADLNGAIVSGVIRRSPELDVKFHRSLRMCRLGQAPPTCRSASSYRKISRGIWTQVILISYFSRGARRRALSREILVNMEQFTLHTDNQGRVMLPAWWRRREGVDSSTELCVAVTEEGSLVVETREQGLRRAKALLRKYIPEGVNLSDELVAERRAEAARESGQRQ
jgi:bifunctional DNA-binding transcriptional regulator/antitoxin component of YhaV-PrlF toxin-antitoxin module